MTIEERLAQVERELKATKESQKIEVAERVREAMRRAIREFDRSHLARLDDLNSRFG